MDAAFTPAERRFRVWMYISAWMYGLAGLFFLVAGMHIAPFVNAVSERFLPLPLYPLPAAQPEGAFWLVLSLSMMAMITWICRSAYLDLRRNRRLVPVLLLSKFCSSVFYLGFFLAHEHLVHLVGALTDGPLFLATLIMWLPAAPGDRCIDETEEDILAAMGEAFIPRGGEMEQGYADFRERSLADSRRLLSVQSPASLMMLRIMIRFIDAMPLLLRGKLVAFRRLPLEQRQDILMRMEQHPRTIVRLSCFAIKIQVLQGFFNQPEVERATGWTLEEETTP